jgi:peptidoglycan/LPS O-acetylase OafA/YrhL
LNVHATRFPLMDSIRAIALLAVVAAHASFFMSVGGATSLSHLRFDFSVRVFFMISGFLLYRPFVRARLREWEAPSTAAYFWRRLLRIVPAYWVALTAIAIWLGISYVFSARGVPTYYGFAQVYQPGWAVGGLPQAWSLCVEVLFYVMLPAWAWLMRRVGAAAAAAGGAAAAAGGLVRRELLGCAALFAASVVYKVAVTATGAIEGPSGVPLQLNTLTFLDDFAVGMALAVLSAWYEGRDLPRPLLVLERFPSIAWGAGFLTLGVTSFGVGLFGHVGENIAGVEYIERHYLLELIAVALLLPAVFGDPARGVVRRILANRALLYMGLVSYAVYLWHFAVYIQLERWGFGKVAAAAGQWIWFPAGLAGGLLLATLSWFLLEKPLIGLKGRVPDRSRAVAGEAIPEPTTTLAPR